MRSTRLFLVGTVLLVSACADDAHQPTAAAPPSAGTHNVVPNGATDDGPALQDALNRGGTIYLRGRYDIYGPLTIYSNTHVYGDRTTAVIYQHTLGNHVFQSHDTTKHVENVTVDSIRFVGKEYPAYTGSRQLMNAAAVSIWRGRNINVRHNTVDYLGIFAVFNEFDPVGVHTYYDQMTETKLSANIEVSDNVGVGRSSLYGDLFGINVGYSQDVRILRNTVRNYLHGIIWIGGDADPGHGRGFHTDPRWARLFRIEGNTVLTTEGGIWGGMGQDIDVLRNYVDGCADVCLDAEGSNNVLFAENDARNAGHAVLDVFFFSKNVMFYWNDVRQDGSYGGYLFHTHNGTQDPAEISISAGSNIFRYMPASGVGLIGKESGQLVFDNNTLYNAVIDMATNNNGATQMRGNTLSLDRDTGGRPAIHIGRNHGRGGNTVNPINSIYQVEIGGNDISSTVYQAARGIYVYENSGKRVNTWIWGNTIREFDPSVHVYGEGTTHYFRIEDNKRTHAITYSGNPTPEVFLYNNTWLSSSTDPGDSPPGGGCEDPTVIIC